MSDELNQAIEQVFGGDEPIPETEPAPAAAPVEPAAPESKKEPSDMARVNVARRAEVRAAQAREEAAKERAEIAKERAELDEIRKEAEAIKAAKLNPSKLMRLAGFDKPRDFLDALAKSEDIESVVERAKAETAPEVEKLRAELEALRNERKADEEKTRAAVLEANVQRAQKAFVDMVEANAEKFPFLTEEYTPEELAAEALRVGSENGERYKKQYGEYPDDSVIAEYLEDQAKARAEKRNAWRQRMGKAAPSSKSGESVSRPPVKGPGPRTLTSRLASEKTPTSPDWTQDDADAESMRILEAAFQKR